MMRQGVDHVERACQWRIMIQVSSEQYFGTRLRMDLTGRMLDSDLIQAMIKHDVYYRDPCNRVSHPSFCLVSSPCQHTFTAVTEPNISYFKCIFILCS